MPKIQELTEAAKAIQFLKNKLPKLGMFSTLDELIQNAPAKSMSPGDWEKYLQPGRTVERAGVTFPLKREELQYSGLPQLWNEIRANPQLEIPGIGDKIHRVVLQSLVRKTRPEFNASIFADSPTAGRPEINLLGKRTYDVYPEPGERAEGDDSSQGDSWEINAPQHSQYALPHEPGHYEVNVTTSPDVGKTSSHFTPRDIVWSRATTHPIDPNQPEGALARMVDEIQSDRHQRAAQRMGKRGLTADSEDLMTPEETEDYNNLHHAIDLETASMNPWAEGEGTHEAYNKANTNRDQLYDMASDIEAQARKRFYDQRIGYRTPADEERVGVWDVTGGPDNPTRSQRFQAKVAKAREPDAPFKEPQDYSMLELKKQLLRAVEDNNRYLGIVTGKDQGDFYQHLNEEQQRGMDFMYDQIYPGQLRKLARQYGTDVKDVNLPFKKNETGAPTLPSIREVEQDPEGWEDVPSRPSHYIRGIYDMTEDTGAALGAHDQMAQEIKSFMVPGHGSEDEVNSFLNAADDWKKGVIESQNKLDAAAGENELTNEEIRDHEATINDGINRMGLMLDRAWRNLPRTRSTLQQKTFPAMELTPEVVDRIKRAGVPLWSAAGAGAGLAAAQENSEDKGMADGGEVDYVGHALGRLGFGGGGEVKVASKLGDLVREFLEHYHNFMNSPEQELTPELAEKLSSLSGQLHLQGVDPKSLIPPPSTSSAPGIPIIAGAPEDATLHAEGGEVNPQPDYGSSLVSLKNYIMGLHSSPDPKEQALGIHDTSGDLPARAATAIARQFYGTDRSGHLVPGGRAWTSEQGGTPMQLLDTISGVPYRLADLMDKVVGIGGKGPPGTEGSVADIPLLAGSRAAAGREDALNAKADRSLAFPKAHTFAQHLADNAGVITPIPLLPAEGALSHVAGFLGGSSLKNFPKMTGEWDLANSGIESLGDLIPDKPAGQTEPEDLVHRSVPGHASGGQSEEPPPPEREDDFLNQMLQHRAMSGLPYGGGGEVGMTTKLMQLLERVKAPPKHESLIDEVHNHLFSRPEDPNFPAARSALEHIPNSDTAIARLNDFRDLGAFDATGYHKQELLNELNALGKPQAADPEIEQAAEADSGYNAAVGQAAGGPISRRVLPQSSRGPRGISRRSHKGSRAVRATG